MCKTNNTLIALTNILRKSWFTCPPVLCALLH